MQTAANTYLATVITNPSSPPLDRSLSSSSSAAPADLVGNLKSALGYTKNDLRDEIIPGLSEQSYNLSLEWEFGYIDGRNGGINKPGTQNTRFPIPVHVSNGDVLTKLQNCTILAYYYDAEGNYLSYGGITFTNNKYTFTQDVWVRFTFAYSPKAVISDVNDANDYISLLHYAGYNRIDNIENCLYEPVFIKKETVTAKISNDFLPVQFTNGKSYSIHFKSSKKLNQTSFYLQIYDSPSTSGTLLKNFGNVWGTQDTSEWLEYNFTSDSNYNGYLRIGYAMDSIPSNTTYVCKVYDLENMGYYDLDAFKNNISENSTKISNIETEDERFNQSLLKPTYSKIELVQQSIAPLTYPVSIVSGHRYRAYFKSSVALNQETFYLQIWQNDMSTVDNVLKNFGNVWGTQDTSNGLVYEFTAENNYNDHAYFRFGYNAPNYPDNCTIVQNLYDLTVHELYQIQELDERIDELEQEQESIASYWKNKKIVWFGTSIPAGVVNAGDEGGNGAYPTRIGQIFNATVYNEAVGSSCVRIGMHGSETQDDPYGYTGMPASCCLYSMSMTVAEKQAIINDWDTWKTKFQNVGTFDPTTEPDKSYNCSYERKLNKYLTGGSVGHVDLYVFDHGYNDAGNLNGSNYSDLKVVPNNLYDRTYFIGAMNFLIDLIKKDDFRASIVIISHYNDEGAFADLIDAQSYIANKWNIPFVNISNKIGFTTAMSVTIDGTTKTMRNWWMPDGLHPASDTSGKALQHYAEVLAPLLEQVR